jgi:hypothetical protein
LSRWVNNGVSVTGYAAEYFSVWTTSGTGQFGPNTVGEFGVSNALNLFTTAISGTNNIDTSWSTNIISIVNGWRLKFLKSGWYWIQFYTLPNDSNNSIQLRIGPVSPPPIITRSVPSGSISIACAAISTIQNVNANDYLVLESTVVNGVFQYAQFLIEYINESSNVINQVTNTSNVTFTSS